MSDAIEAQPAPIHDRVVEIIGSDWIEEMNHRREVRERAEVMAHRMQKVCLTARAITALDHLEDHDARACGALISALVERMRAGLPIPVAETMRQDALYWAETALELELVEFLAAGLRELGERGMGQLLLPARKRMLVALFMSLPDGERRSFLARVDPRGLFTARAS